jgi:hypothetical protein
MFYLFQSVLALILRVLKKLSINEQKQWVERDYQVENTGRVGRANAAKRNVQAIFSKTFRNVLRHILKLYITRES